MHSRPRKSWHRPPRAQGLRAVSAGDRALRGQSQSDPRGCRASVCAEMRGTSERQRVAWKGHRRKARARACRLHQASGPALGALTMPSGGGRTQSGGWLPALKTKLEIVPPTSSGQDLSHETFPVV
ncbi:hypothetical protein H8959_013718 [Pygathrix nigripes]